jgi:hypothetical protein
MKRLVRLLVLLWAFGICVPTDGFAQKKTVHVKEYTKKDGTTVKAHDRKAPEKHATTAPAAKPKPATAPKPATNSKPKRESTVKSPAVVVARDERGRIQRSDAARHAFARKTGYPNGRPGYVIDHIVPLACGGADVPANMQWQAVADAKTKDKTERVGCR